MENKNPVITYDTYWIHIMIASKLSIRLKNWWPPLSSQSDFIHIGCEKTDIGTLSNGVSDLNERLLYADTKEYITTTADTFKHRAWHAGHISFYFLCNHYNYVKIIFKSRKDTMS